MIRIRQFQPSLENRSSLVSVALPLLAGVSQTAVPELMAWSQSSSYEKLQAVVRQTTSPGQ
jgi:hypothetical protein